MPDKKSILVDKIATAVIRMIHFENLPQGSSYAAYIEEKLHYNYTYLARVFSSARGLTIERFIIIHKIERAKEFLEYGNLSLTEISHLLFYSSPAHLSNQFKVITGLTPAVYKRNKDLNRKKLEGF